MADRSGDNGSSSLFVLGFVLGAIIGGVVGLLFAPQTGVESRSDLLVRGSRMRDRARTLGESGGDALRDAITEGRDAAGRAREEMEQWVRRSRAEEEES